MIEVTKAHFWKSCVSNGCWMNCAFGTSYKKLLISSSFYQRFPIVFSTNIFLQLFLIKVSYQDLKPTSPSNFNTKIGQTGNSTPNSTLLQRIYKKCAPNNNVHSFIPFTFCCFYFIYYFFVLKGSQLNQNQHDCYSSLSNATVQTYFISPNFSFQE